MTFSRNATNDFQTERERLAYGSVPYMQFHTFAGGGARAPTNSETVQDSAKCSRRNRSAKDLGI